MELNIKIVFLFSILIIFSVIIYIYIKKKQKILLEELKQKKNEEVKERILNNSQQKYKNLTEPSRDIIYGIINQKVEKKLTDQNEKINKPIGWIKSKNYEEDINEVENKQAEVSNDINTKNKFLKIKTSVLLVDDSITIRKYIGDILKKMNFDVHIKNNGEEALEYINSNMENFDLIITDIEMPKMNGSELVKNIRNNNKFKNIPILVISAKAEIHLWLMEEEMIQGFMHKPFDNKDFENQVNYLLKN